MNFLKKFEELRKSIPVPAVSIGPFTTASDHVEYVYQSKNCHYCYNTAMLEDSIHSQHAWGKNLVDCFHSTESELCYECTDCNKCYGCVYCEDCMNCTNCYYSVLCNSCTDCFGCVSLTRKKYCIFNKQYSEEEYRNRVSDLLKKKPIKTLAKVHKMAQKIPHPQSHQRNNVNCPYGDYIHDSKNVYWGFDTYYLENCGYVYMGGMAKDCWDVTFAGQNMELCYEMSGSARCYNSAYIFESGDCTDCFYGAWLRHCEDCWGCVGLTKKKYCVLNNQLTKEEYKKAVKEIKAELGWK